MARGHPASPLAVQIRNRGRANRKEKIVDSKIVGCMFVSMLVGGGCAAAALAAGWGPLAGLAIYSASGSASLVSTAALAAYAPSPRVKCRPRATAAA